MEDKKIVIGEEGIKLEGIVVGTILVFDKIREEKVTKINYKTNELCTEKSFLSEKDDPWVGKYTYSGKIIYPNSKGELYKTEESPRIVRPNRETRDGEEIHGSQ